MNENFRQQVIQNLEDLDASISDGNTYYTWSSINFLYKKNVPNYKKLLISFHGALKIGSEIKPPIFRMYNYGKNEYDVLSISDKLVEEFFDKGLVLSWYQSTDTRDYETCYQNIIKYVSSKYEDVVFSGSSGGGLPALLYGCIFKRKVLIQNSQLYLKKHKFYEKAKNIISPDKFIDVGTEIHIKKYGSPLYALVMQNKGDTNHYINHWTPFKSFIKEDNTDKNFNFIEFESAPPAKSEVHPVRDYHHIISPDGTTTRALISNLFVKKI
jgi:hypothetical protein